MKRMITGFLCFLAVLAAQPALAGWVYETIAISGDQGQYASIAMDSQDRSHAAWYDATDATLNNSVREFAGWTPEVVVDSGQVGKYASIAINPVTDHPAIAYFNDDINAAEYAYYNGTSWVTETIDDSDDYDRGEWISLDFSSTGVPYVSYWYDDGLWNDNGLRIAWRTSKGWTSYDLDDVTQLTNERVGIHSALIMVQDYPWIAYRTEATFNIGQWFGWKDGSGWDTEPTINDTGLGEYTDIAVDSSDNVHISSVWIRVADDCAALIYKYAGDWYIEEIECGDDDDFGKYTSIAIDSLDTVYVTYFGNDALNLAVRSGDSWELNILDSNGVTGKHTDMVLDSAERPHIVYYDAGNKDVKYAYDLPAPVLFTITPDTGVNDAPVTDVVLTGTGFHITSVVKLINPVTQDEIPCTNQETNSPLLMVCDFDITGARTGPWDVFIDNPSGEFTLEEGFTVTSNAPSLFSVVPDTSPNDDSAFAVTLTGDFFTHNMSVQLKKGILPAINAFDVQTASMTSAMATFNLKNKATGLYDVIVTTDWGTATIEDGFEITCAAPEVEFNADPAVGNAPLTVSFFDASTDYNTCEIETWEWDFGDGGTSTEQNPTYIYTTPGKYHVTLGITSPGGDDDLTKYFFIKVYEPAGDDDDDTTDDDDDATDDDDAADDDDDDTPPGDDDESDDDSDKPDPGSEDDELDPVVDDEDEGDLSGGCSC